MDGQWRFKGRRLHIRFSRSHEYMVGFPVTGVCRSCQTLNEIGTPPQDSHRSLETVTTG